MRGNGPWKVAAGAAAIALLAAGCSSGSSDDDETLPNTISIGIAEPESLVPTNTTEANGSQVLSSLFYPLVRFDEKSTPYLVAAESITHDKANKVWTIKLRSGFTFSNGEERVRLAWIRRKTAGDLRDSRVARFTKNRFYAVLARQLPGERVLSSAIADNENLHES